MEIKSAWQHRLSCQRSFILNCYNKALHSICYTVIGIQLFQTFHAAITHKQPYINTRSKTPAPPASFTVALQFLLNPLKPKISSEAQPQAAPVKPHTHTHSTTLYELWQFQWAFTFYHCTIVTLAQGEKKDRKDKQRLRPILKLKKLTYWHQVIVFFEDNSFSHENCWLVTKGYNPLNKYFYKTVKRQSLRHCLWHGWVGVIILTIISVCKNKPKEISIYIQCPPLILPPLVIMNKGGCENN